MDITMCPGGNCPNKEKCYRFTATPSPYWQAWFIQYPDNSVEGEEIDCSMFMDNSKDG